MSFKNLKVKILPSDDDDAFDLTSTIDFKSPASPKTTPSFILSNNWGSEIRYWFDHMVARDAEECDMLILSECPITGYLMSTISGSDNWSFAVNKVNLAYQEFKVNKAFEKDVLGSEEKKTTVRARRSKK